MDTTALSSWISENPLLAGTLITAILICAAGIVYAAVRFVPRGAFFLLLLNLFVHLLTYVLPKCLPIPYVYHDLTSALDRLTPFFSPMVAIYLLAFVQWALYWILLSRERKELRSRFLAGEWISKFICMLVFLFWPTTLVRPAITGTGLFDRLTALVYLIDTPSNLLPSVHCLTSWFCLRSALQFRNAPKWYLAATLIFTLLVFISTVMVKQHVWIDVPTAVLAAEAGLLLADRTRLDTVLGRWEDSFSGKA